MRIIITGGTFDKCYDPLRGELGFADTHLPQILERVRCTVDVQLEIVELIDSLQMRTESRRRILARCRDCVEQQLVITHGTDTMSRTAHVLGEADLGKTIVLTGAMVPYAVSGSDALFNLGGAILEAQTLPPGVYIAMNGRVFTWDNVRKDTDLGVFVEAESE